MSLRMTPRIAYYVLIAFTVVLIAAFSVLDYVAPGGRHLSTIAGVDRVNYFDTTHSILFDHDFNLNNEYKRIKPDDEEWTAIVPKTGLPASPWGIAYSVLEVPFLAVGVAGDAIAGHPADGYSYFARFIYALGNVVIGGLGLMALFHLLYRASSSWGVESSRAAWYSLFACFAVFFGTNVGYYAFSLISHATTFLLLCLFLAYWWKVRSTAIASSWFFLGLLGGFASISRWQDVVYVAGPIIYDLLGPEWRKNILSWLRLRVCYGLGLLVSFIPQMFQWKMIYGKWLTIPQGGGIFSFPPTHMLHILFASQNGWFIWTPLIAIGMIGVAYGFFKNHAREFTPWIIAALIEVAVVGSLSVWHGVESFGARYMLSGTPLASLGLMVLLCKSPKLVSRSVMAATMLSCIFTMLFAIQYRMDLIPKGRTLTTKELFADKFHLIAIHRQKVLANTAQRYLNEGNPSSAFALLERADSMGEDRDVITILGNAYRAIGDSAKAEEEELRLKRFLAKGYDSQVVFGRTAH